MSISKEKIEGVFKEFGGSEKNTGSTEGQVALFTEKIQHVSQHLETNKKDFSSARSLLGMVGKRKRLLKYLAKKDITAYRSIIEKLNLRK
ncbi:MAG: 30S ribosomal protein S15 [Bacteroidetes bacterium]|nr:30S ribosomal protein S15 [Bacteroidota bacterium]